jgi:hypothetical protein
LNVGPSCLAIILISTGAAVTRESGWRIKRVAFGFTNLRNYRVRVLLYAGKPNWDLLTTITPR